MKKLISIIFLTLLTLSACSAEFSVDKVEVAGEVIVGDEETVSTNWTKTNESDLFVSWAGDATVRGYIVYKPYYVGEDMPHFQVIQEDLTKLPEFYHGGKFGYFRLINPEDGNELVSEEVIKTLENNYSETNPATIVTNVILQPMEGTPSMTLVEIK